MVQDVRIFATQRSLLANLQAERSESRAYHGYPLSGASASNRFCFSNVERNFLIVGTNPQEKQIQ